MTDKNIKQQNKKSIKIYNELFLIYRATDFIKLK